MTKIAHPRITADESGQTATEFALVLPIFCLLLFGVIQFGIVFNNHLALTDAVRAGARTATVSRHAPDPAKAARDRVKAAAANLDESKLVVTVTATSPWEHGQDVTVKATYPYKISLFGLDVTEGDLTSSTTERIE